ncbi:MAG: HNH endonuclease signature motif containing protein [Candidatus Limiplasma sp.]|nr:HNH endonuclease signature motif containing protein [Candidatus Limiplasma sp.]
MPMKPKRPCGKPGCPELTAGRYCGAHAREAEALYNKYRRDPNTKQRYGRMWPRIRARQLAQHPLCAMCQKDGRATPANEVHHIVPLSQGGTHAPENLMSLCKSCHSRITASEGGRWKQRGL